MSANLSSGTSQSYEAPGIRIFQGLKPDVVAVQEFRYNGSSGDVQLRQLVDLAFGTNFYFYREPYTGSGDIPNGIVSRWPIVNTGSWDDPLISNRGFAWAQIRLPGTNDLYVVSVHLYSGGTEADRNSEATVVKNAVAAQFPAGAWVIVAGDFNTSSRSESAVSTFGTFLSDKPVPADQAGDPDTNEPRNNPYDYLLPSFSFTNRLTPVQLGTQSFSRGLVFDSRVYQPLAEVAPVQVGDSGVSGMQHMAVVKDFVIQGWATNTSSTSPYIVSQPQNQSAQPGATVAFSIGASGQQPLAYQWFFGSTPVATAWASLFTITNVQPADAGGYWVVITNQYGAVTSSIATLTVTASPSTGVITRWDFNGIPPDGSTTTGTLLPAIGAGTADYVGGAAAPSSGQFASGSGSTDTAADNSAWNTSSYPAANSANKTAGVLFRVSTTGRKEVSVRWDCKASNTGSKYLRLQYSTNGTTFMDHPSSTLVSTNFESRTNNLSTLPGVSDNANFAFRLVAEFENTATGAGSAAYAGAGTSYTTGGTIRFDAVTVLGTELRVQPPAQPPLLSAPQVAANHFQFNLTRTPGTFYVVQTTTDLETSNWVSLATNAAPFLFTEPDTRLNPARYYRALVAP